MIFSIIKYIIQSFREYSLTDEFYKNLSVELFGMLIELVFVAILLNWVLSSFSKRRLKYISIMGSINVTHIVHKWVEILLNLFQIKDVQDLIIKKNEEDPNFQMYWHFLYGNLENKLNICKDIVNKDSIQNHINNIPLRKLSNLSKKANDCLFELDRLISISSLCSKTTERLYGYRCLIYPFRDALVWLEEAVENKESNKSLLISKLDELSRMLIDAFGGLFQEEKKIIDASVSRDKRKQQIKMLMELLLKHPIKSVKYFIINIFKRN